MFYLTSVGRIKKARAEQIVGPPGNCEGKGPYLSDLPTLLFGT